MLHFVAMVKTILSAALVILTMGSTSKGEHFFNANRNLTNITWAHAVNNASYLDTVLNGPFNMIEADVSIGMVKDTNLTVPIMAHPPNTVSDISLETFLLRISLFNGHSSNSKSKKGIKLDFKSFEAFNASIPIIQKEIGNQTVFPLWLNADILPGPVNATTTPVNADLFLAGAKNFSSAILSLGWTTKYTSNDRTIVNGNYSSDHIKEMVDVIKRNSVSQNVTFAVRAGIAAESIPQIKNLTNLVANSTITIWSSEGDSVNATKLSNLISEIGVSRTYIDVPESLWKQINFTHIFNSNSSNGNRPNSGSVVGPGILGNLLPLSIFLALLLYVL